MIIVWCELWTRTQDNKRDEFIKSVYYLVNTDNSVLADKLVKKDMNVKYPKYLMTMAIRPVKTLEVSYGKDV